MGRVPGRTGCTGKIPVAERSGSGCLSGKTDGKMDSDSLQLEIYTLSLHDALPICQYAIFEVEIPENWIGKNVGQLDIRKKYGINILATRKYGKTDVAVSPETVLNGDATILVLGEYKAIQKCFRI